MSESSFDPDERLRQAADQLLARRDFSVNLRVRECWN